MDLRSKILNGEVATKKLDVPEWEGVYIKRLSARQAKKLASDESKTMACMVVLCLCDEHGKRLLQDGDEDKLMDIDVATLNKVITQVTEFNSGKSIDDIKKN